MSLILALDQSTSATKAVLFDARGKVLDKSAFEHRQIYPQPGWVEHDADEIWFQTLAAIRDVAKRNPHRLSKLAGLSLTNQRETIVVFDRQTGHPLHNALVWQDRRGDPVCQKLVRQGHEDLVRRRTGLKIDTYFSASKLRWLIENKPALAAKLKNGRAIIGTMDAYLIHRLTAAKIFATDFTNASRTLLFDIGRLRWDAQLCKLFKVPMSALPEVQESAAHFGETDAGGILPQRIPIIGVMGDSQASLFAQRCYQPGTAKATFGTGTSVLLNVGRRLRVSRRGAVTALAWVWRGQPTYAFEGLINFSAATIAWLKNQLGLISDAAEIEKLAASIKDNGGVYLVPAFAGLGAPQWNAEARGTIIGLTRDSRLEHIVRAGLEAVAYQTADLLDALRADGAPKIESLLIDGGLTANAWAMQFLADICDVEVARPKFQEVTALGAARLAASGAGLIALDSATAPTSARWTPRMSAAEREMLRSGWRGAVSAALAAAKAA